MMHVLPKGQKLPVFFQGVHTNTPPCKTERCVTAQRIHVEAGIKWTQKYLSVVEQIPVPGCRKYSAVVQADNHCRRNQHSPKPD